MLTRDNPLDEHAVIFDLDNTLLDRKKSLKSFSQKLLQQYIEKDYSEDLIYEHLITADGDGYQSKEDIHKILLDNLPWITRPSFTEFSDIWDTEFPGSSELMNGAIDILEYLTVKGYKLALITNGKSIVQNLKIDAAQIRKYFKVILISEDVKMKKPEKEIFHLTLDKLKVPLKNSYYIGDHPKNDVYGAINAGLKAIWLEGYCEWDDSIKVKNFITIKKLSDLYEILPKLLK